MAIPQVAVSNSFNDWRLITNTVATSIGDLSNIYDVSKTSLVLAANDLNTRKFNTTGGPITGNISVSGTLGVTGAATFSSTLGVTGDLLVNTNKFSVASLSGNTIVGGSLSVAGISTLSTTSVAAFSATGAATFSSTLMATGATTLGSTLQTADQINITSNNATKEAIKIIGRAADNSGRIGFYANNGTTQYGHILSSVSGISLLNSTLTTGLIIDSTTGGASFGNSISVTGSLQTTGTIGIGTNSSASIGLLVQTSSLTSGNQVGVQSSIIGNASATLGVAGIYLQPSTAAAAFTCAAVYGAWVDNAVKGAGSTITNQYGLYIANQTQGVNNYSIWTGTAPSVFNGNLTVSAGSGDSVLTIGTGSVSGTHRAVINGGGVNQNFGYYLGTTPALVTNTGSANILRIGSDAVVGIVNTVITYSSASPITTVSATGLAVTGAISATTDTSTATLSLPQSFIATGTVTTAAVTPAQVIYSLSTAVYRSAECIIQGYDAIGSKFHTAKMIAVHNGTIANSTEYSSIDIGGVTGLFSADVSGGLMRILVTPSSANSTVFKITITATKI